jgi:DNA-binding NarL/FixJ family response regulator
MLQTQDPEEMLQMVRDLQPQVVLLDTALCGAGIPATLAAVHESSTHSSCVVLVDNAQQVIEAEKAGAHLAVLKGFPAQKLAAALSALCQGTGVAN